MIERQAIIDAARACLGTRFHHQGRVPGVGLDCVGLLVAVARSVGLDYVDLAAYARRPDGKILVDTLRANPCLVELESPAHAREGDVLVFEFVGKAFPQHVAIRTDRGMIHTFATLRKVVEHGYDDYWRGHAVHAFTFKGAA